MPDSAQVNWMGDFDRDGRRGAFPTVFLLSQHTLPQRPALAYPPEELTAPMFTPIGQTTADGQSGYGMQLPRFIWEQYEGVAKAPPTDIGLCTR
jgi:hypothetical protein